MFEQLFRYPGVIERYHAGPHAEDRLRYLVHLAGTGARTQTLQLAASRQLALVQLLDVRDDQRVLREQLDAAIERWAQPRPRRRGPASPAAVAAFRGTVTHWLHFVGRLAIAESPPRPFASCVTEFADWMRERGLVEATIRGRCCVAAEFLDWFHAWNRPLGSLTIADVDRAVAAKSEQGRCGRIALHGYLKYLRAFFRFAEAQGWCAPGLAEAVAPPRLYAGETVPAGLAWDDVQRLLASTEGARPADRRDRAALLLLAVYGLRAGEVCGLRLDDVDWDAETLRVRRPKPGRTHLYPLSMSVGEALLGYLRESRPQRVRRQLLSPVALPHLGMLPTVLRKIVLRFQPGTGQFLVTRPARARWRDSIGGNVSAHHRVSCPVHAGARHAGDLVDHHGLYGTGCRRRRRAPDTGHRSLNPNVTPPGLRPGAREGEPQARRCRSRVSVPSSAVERGPGRSARPVGRRHAQASRAGQRPGRTEPPRGRPDNRGAAAWQWAGSAPSPRRRAPRWRSRRPPRAVRNRMSPSPSGTGHRSLNPNVTPPGLRPGAREGEPQARRCRSRVSVPSSAVERGPGRSARPVGRRHAQASRAGQRPGRTEPPRGRPDNRGTAAWQWAGSAPAPAA